MSDSQPSGSLPAVSSFFPMYSPTFPPYVPSLYEPYQYYSGFPSVTSLPSTCAPVDVFREQSQFTSSPLYSTVFSTFASVHPTLCTQLSGETSSSDQAQTSSSGLTVTSSETSEEPSTSGVEMTRNEKNSNNSLPGDQSPVQNSSPDVERSCRKETGASTGSERTFPALIVYSCDRIRPVLLYNAPDTNRCYSFSYSRKKSRFDVYLCNGCYETKKEMITVLVNNNHFQSDPARLEHICTPKLLTDEISAWTNRKVKLPLTRYLVVQKVVVKKDRKRRTVQPRASIVQQTAKSKDTSLVKVSSASIEANRCFLFSSSCTFRLFIVYVFNTAMLKIFIKHRYILINMYPSTWRKYSSTLIFIA
ncbi:hypothetical protein NECAME_01576 [Necator americanus]|uniref:Uncharacterized protein n=1 Tax=Necator americanus TaxID=51031 RepID=W2TTN3_NECAM|nr:hypothetical protein NECAME_01576 [Necator americanus]ETN85014.1 hypothetical protein NECAME_01576 [Necator americanus]